MLDVVAHPLHEAVELMETLDVKYTVTVTEATSKKFLRQEDCFYVIQQHVSNDGSYKLIVAAKMGKEV
ncbi:MAG: hypothetical protein LLG02_02745 [Pelosinus sp.]|nr:hypothetical protein [Pelosinus sp.]